MKWYNLETEEKRLKDGLTRYLKENGIYYELSGCFNGWHFEIKCSPEEAEKINNWIDEQ